jgi:hypothetical protein
MILYIYFFKVILAARCDHFKTLFGEGLKPEQVILILSKTQAFIDSF